MYKPKNEDDGSPQMFGREHIVSMTYAAVPAAMIVFVDFAERHDLFGWQAWSLNSPLSLVGIALAIVWVIFAGFSLVVMVQRDLIQRDMFRKVDDLEDKSRQLLERMRRDGFGSNPAE